MQGISRPNHVIRSFPIPGAGWGEFFHDGFEPVSGSGWDIHDELTGGCVVSEDLRIQFFNGFKIRIQCLCNVI